MSRRFDIDWTTDELPLYPEQRVCGHPTTEQILGLFSLAQRHKLAQNGKQVEVFDVQLTDLQRQSHCSTSQSKRSSFKKCAEIPAILHSRSAECKSRHAPFAGAALAHASWTCRHFYADPRSR
jgi:hypothetical protein